MRRLAFEHVDVQLVDTRPATWTFAGSPMRGREHRYSVVDRNHQSRNTWEFVVHVPDEARGRVEVRPVRVPNDSSFAGLDRRSITFMPATMPRYRQYRYCQLSLADPVGGASRRVVNIRQKGELPYWLSKLGWRLRRKSTVRRTRGTDGESLAVLVGADDHRMMICLFLGTKAWIIKRGISLCKTSSHSSWTKANG